MLRRLRVLSSQQRRLLVSGLGFRVLWSREFKVGLACSSFFVSGQGCTEVGIRCKARLLACLTQRQHESVLGCEVVAVGHVPCELLQLPGG